MALTNTAVPGSVTDNGSIYYPVPVFHFKVTIGDHEGVFTEVSGLTNDVEVIEYRHGMSKGEVFKMPGLSNTSDITLKKGVFKTDYHLYEWFYTVNLHTIQRRDIIISLLDENSDPVMTWEAHNCFPKSFTGPDLNAGSSEMSVESVELAHERLKILV
jgi:phage tail-like protein